MADTPTNTAPATAQPATAAREEEHCANCLWLKDPLTPTDGFWACQNLCIRE